MPRLVYQEWIKLKRQILFRILLLFLLLLALIGGWIGLQADNRRMSSPIFLSYTQRLEQVRHSTDCTEETLALEKERLTLEQALAVIEKERLGLSESITLEEREAFQEVKAQWGLDEELWRTEKSEVLKPLIEQLHYVNEADSLRQNISKDIHRRLIHPLYRRDSYARRSLEKQEKVFQKSSAKPVLIRADQERGFRILTKLLPIQGVIFLIELLLAELIFTREYPFQMAALWEATPPGTKRVVLSKEILFFYLSAVLSLCLWGTILLVLVSRNAFGDLDRSIQSISLFLHRPVIETVRQWLIRLFIQLQIGQIALSSTALLLNQSSRKEGKRFLILLLILTEEWVRWRLVSPHSWLNFLWATSLPVLTNAVDRTGNYGDVNVLGLPVEQTILSNLFILFLFVGTLLLAYRRGIRNLTEETQKSFAPFWQKWMPQKLFWAEGWRLWIEKRCLLLLGAVLVVSGFTVQKEKGSFFSPERYYYLFHLNPIQGIVSEDTDNKLAEMGEIYATLPEREKALETAIKNRSLSKQEELAQQEQLTLERNREPFFRKVYDQVQQSREKSNNRIPLYVIDEKIDQYWHQPHSTHLLWGVMSSAFLILALSAVWGSDFQNGMENLLQSTQYGQARLLRVRLGWVFVLSCLLTILSACHYGIEAQATGNLLPLKASIFSLPSYVNFGVEMPIWILWIWQLLYRGLAFCLDGIVITYLSLKTGHRWLTLLLSGLLILLPQVIFYLLGVKMPFYWLLGDAFYFPEIWGSSGFGVSLLSSLSLLVLISLFCHFMVKNTVKNH